MSSDDKLALVGSYLALKTSLPEFFLDSLSITDLQYMSISYDGCLAGLARAEKDKKQEHSPPITVIQIKCSRRTNEAGAVPF